MTGSSRQGQPEALVRAGRGPRPQQGAMLLIVMLFVLVSTLAASALVQSYQTQARREREAELLFVGDQYRRAIAAYYGLIPPGGRRALPESIDALLNDQRFATPIQHLRRAYADPMTGQADWVLVRTASGIAGVHSRSTQQPLKQAGFHDPYRTFDGAQRYADWVFAIKP